MLEIKGMSDSKEEAKTMLGVKKIGKEEFEHKKANFDLNKAISNFILKKDYFISHK